MSLARAEARRFFKRRFTRLMILLVVALMAAVAAMVAAQHERPGPAALAQAQARAEREYEQQQQWVEEEMAACERARESGELGADGRWPAGFDCQQIRAGQPDPEEMAQWYLPPAFDFRDQFPQMITVLVGLLSLFAFIVGASFVGAEWRSGGMMNLLLWRPRRLRVLGVKLGTFLAALAGLTVLAAAAWTAAFWQVATYRGITDTMTPGAWESFALTGLRGLALVLVAGTAGFALASLGRHTAMALGVAITAFVVGVAGLGIVVGMVDAPYPQAWLWPTYLQAWMEKAVVLRDLDSCADVGRLGECVPATMEITWQVSGVGLAVLVVLLLGAAGWHMRRRDVA